jgi:uncharacterized membrane protein YdjX (TVP38/TMEM64 family)
VALKNYGLAMTQVSFSRFLLSAVVGEIPGTLALVWTGSSSGDLLGLLHGSSSGKGEGALVGLLGGCSLVVGMGVLGTRIHAHLRSLEFKGDRSPREV